MVLSILTMPRQLILKVFVRFLSGLMVWSSQATLQAVDYQVAQGGSKFRLRYQDAEYPVEIPLSGKFNVYNTLAAMAALLAENVPLDHVLEHIHSAPQVAGRFERVEEGQPFTVIVDYAHTPDGFRKSFDDCPWDHKK